MALGVEYCHPIDVSMAIMGEFERADSAGKLVKEGVIRREIMNQSGIVLGKLRNEFGSNLKNYGYWQAPPFPHPSQNAGTIELLAGTLTEATIGMQQITLTFTSSTELTIRGTVSGTIATGVDIGSNYNANGITFNANQWTGTAEIGDVIYMLGYLVHPMVAAITAKLSAIEIVDQFMRKMIPEGELKLIAAGHKRYTQLLNDLRDGKADLGSRTYVETGFYMNLPQWTIDETGEDASAYRNVVDPGTGSILG